MAMPSAAGGSPARLSWLPRTSVQASRAWRARQASSAASSGGVRACAACRKSPRNTICRGAVRVDQPIEARQVLLRGAAGHRLAQRAVGRGLAQVQVGDEQHALGRPPEGALGQQLQAFAGPLDLAGSGFVDRHVAALADRCRRRAVSAPGDCPALKHDAASDRVQPAPSPARIAACTAPPAAFSSCATMRAMRSATFSFDSFSRNRSTISGKRERARPRERLHARSCCVAHARQARAQAADLELLRQHLALGLASSRLPGRTCGTPRRTASDEACSCCAALRLAGIALEDQARRRARSRESAAAPARSQFRLASTSCSRSPSVEQRSASSSGVGQSTGSAHSSSKP